MLQGVVNHHDNQEHQMTTSWDYRTAAKNLGVEVTGLSHFGTRVGEIRGISDADHLAIDPTCQEPQFVGAHELAHIVLRHTPRNFSEMRSFLADPERAKSRHEVEAHTVAMLVSLKTGLRNWNHLAEMDYLLDFGGGDWKTIKTYIRDNQARLVDAAQKITAAGLPHAMA